MRKVLALMLAALMLLTLSVGALAEDLAGNNSDIATYGILTDGKDSHYVNQGYVMTSGTLEIGKTYSQEELMALWDTQDIYVGDTIQMSLYYVERATGDDPYTVVSKYTGRANWQSGDTKALTISSTGLVKAVGTGDFEKVTRTYITVVVPANAGSLDYDDYDQNRFRVLAEDAEPIDDDVVIRPVDDPSVTELEMTVGDTIQLGAFTQSDLKPYTGEVHWKGSSGVTVSDTGLARAVATKFYYNADGSFNDKGTGDYARASVTAEVPESRSGNAYISIKVNKGDTPVTPEDPDKPTPKPPVVDSGAAPADKAPQATDNAANDDKTTDALASGKTAEVKVTNGSAAISTETANLLGGSTGKLVLQNGGMTVTIPGGFGKVTEAGRVYYPFDYETSPKNAAEMLAAVKTEGAKSEAVKAGGVMTLPTAATVTLKTKLTGTVNVYWYNEDTGRFTLVASPVAKDGAVTFTTRQMGCFLLTTGRV